MDRVTLRAALSSRVEAFRLDGCGEDIYIKRLSALDRARIVDKHNALGKAGESDHPLETITVETQCYIVARGLVDEKGNRLYRDDELQAIAEEIPAKTLDELSNKILTVSGMIGDVVDAAKNSNPIRNGSSNSGSPPGSDGGMPTPSSIN